jgi:hypothetical protein
VIDDGLRVYDAGLTVSTSPWLGPGSDEAGAPYDLAKGVKLLEGKGRIRSTRDDQRTRPAASFVMTCPTGSTSILGMVQLMKQDWATEGIQVTLEGVSFPTMLQYHREPDKWQIGTGLKLTGGIGYQVDECVFATNGPLNFIGYSNPQMDRIRADALLPQPSLQAARSGIYAYRVHCPSPTQPVDARGDWFRAIAKMCTECPVPCRSKVRSRFILSTGGWAIEAGRGPMFRHQRRDLTDPTRAGSAASSSLE